MITTRRITSRDFNEDLLIRDFCLFAFGDANMRHGNRFTWQNFPAEMIDQRYFNIAFVDGEPMGLMMASMLRSVFDGERILVRQELFWVHPSQPFGVAHRLFQEFIDFGRLNADDILTNLNTQTNVKAGTLKKLGFEELETVYRLEVKNVK